MGHCREILSLTGSEARQKRSCDGTRGLPRIYFPNLRFSARCMRRVRGTSLLSKGSGPNTFSKGMYHPRPDYIYVLPICIGHSLPTARTISRLWPTGFPPTQNQVLSYHNTINGAHY